LLASAIAFAAPSPLQRVVRETITSVVSVVGRARVCLLIGSVAAVLIQRVGQHLEAKRAMTDAAIEEGFELSPGSVTDILRRAKETANREANSRVEAVKKSAAERELLDSAEIKRLQTTLSAYVPQVG
jgi:hypothetical protein